MKIDIILSIIIFIMIVVIKYFQNKKSNKYQDQLYLRIKKINILLIIISIVTFIAVFLINHYIEKESSIFLNILNALSISLISLPITSFGLYHQILNDEDKLTKITNIVTDIVDEKYTKLFNQAGIHLVILSKNKPRFIKESILEKDYKRNLLTKNIHIKTSSKDILSKMKNENIIYEFNSLEKLYKRLINARGEHDNYLRSLKYIVLTYLPLFLAYIVFKITGFPFNYNLLLILIAKLLTILTLEFVYKKMPYDIDLKFRKPLKKSNLFGTQESIFLFIESLIIMIGLSIPYMFILSQGGNILQSNTIFYNTFIYINILLTLCLYSEQLLIKNSISILKRINILIYILISILISIALNYFHYFKTMNIGLNNHLGIIIMSMFAILMLELIKIARLTTVKGVKKNESKNHKKHQRS